MRNTKDRIVIAAVNIFAEKGYTETSMREIADAVSLSAASLYNHFPSKMAILEHILDIYSGFANQNIVDMSQVMDNMDAASILRAVFFSFPDDKENLYPRILKIILQEQYRIERIHEYMRDGFFVALQTGIKSLLDLMVEKGKIAPLDTARYAKLFNYVSVASAVEFCHYTAEEYAATQTVTQYELLETLIDIIVSRTQ